MLKILASLVLIGIGFYCLTKASDHFSAFKATVKKENIIFVRLLGPLAFLVPDLVGPGGGVALIKCFLYLFAIVLISMWLMVLNGVITNP